MLLLLVSLVRIIIFCQIEPTIHSSFISFISLVYYKKSIKSHVAQTVLHGSLLLKSWMVKIEQ